MFLLLLLLACEAKADQPVLYIPPTPAPAMNMMVIDNGPRTVKSPGQQFQEGLKNMNDGLEKAANIVDPPKKDE